MNEVQKTLAFIGAAAVVIVGVVLARPSLPAKDEGDVRGQRLFPNFNDPLAAKSMEIVEYDQATATVRPFQVAQVRGRWSIPSHENYPADAKDQVAQAAAGMMNLTILEDHGDSPGDHANFGVVDPDPKTIKSGATGVGTRVTMSDAAGKALLSLIIGKAVKDRPGLHYVRRTGQDQVYVVAAKTDKLSTKFEDWIEKDLLKIDPWDIQQVQIRDHSVDEMQGALVQRGEMKLGYNDTADPKWKLAEDREFTGREWKPRTLAADEELNAARLDEMKNALDDLKIVDVRPKPKGLSADLKAADDFTKNREAIQSLAQKGFYVARLGERVELFSNQGEIRTLMKNGVEYILRFGEIAMDTGGGSSKKEEGKEVKPTGLNRYIFVTTEFNEGAIAKPELEKLPAEAKEEKKPEAKAESKPDPKAEKPEAKAESKPDPKAERERIEKDNKRKQDEYDEKVKAGKEKVTELNGRFADWYYVISDETYGKIHLGRKDLVKKKENKDAAKDGATADKPGATPKDFDALKSAGPGGAKN